MQTLKEYSTELREQFARYGFIASPLTPEQIIRCKTAGLSIDVAYDLGCDVVNGYDFYQSLDRAVTIMETTQ